MQWGRINIGTSARRKTASFPVNFGSVYAIAGMAWSDQSSTGSPNSRDVMLPSDFSNSSVTFLFEMNTVYGVHWLAIGTA